MTLKNLAQHLVSARQLGNSVQSTEHPTSLEMAYELQSLVTEASKDQIVGYKIGATATETQGILGLNEPFLGPLLKTHCLQAGTEATELALHSNYAASIECEFVVGLKQALRRKDAPVTADDVAAATDWVAAGFELVGTRFATTPQKGYCAIGDNGNNIAVITGRPSKDWTMESLKAHPVSLSVNGKAAASGHSGVSVAGHPFAMLAWLVNHDEIRQRGLNAGEIVYTGTCTGAIQVSIGDVINADFGSLGQLGLRLRST